MKKLVSTVGAIGGLIGIVYAVLYVSNKNKKIESKKIVQAKNNNEIILSTHVLDFNTEKNQISNSISERHIEAANIIRDAVSTVISYDENMSKFKKEFAELEDSIDILLD